MPYKIVSQGDKFCVAKADSGEVLKGACHATREEAKAQLTAIMLSELRAQGRDVPPAMHSATFAIAAKEGAPKSPPKGYPESRDDYADPTNYKYPIDTEAHVRAAWSYINQADNRKGYSAEELSAIEGRIKRAAQKFGIEISAGMNFATFDLGPQTAEDDGFIYRAGKIFAAGRYEDKDFEITPEELVASAAAFERVAIDLEHVPSVLDQKLGFLEAVEAADDGTLYGVTALPKWLDDLLEEGERKVSATLDRATKRIAGLALVRSPRVTDAALMAAFAASADGMQQMHDLSRKHGARCAASYAHDAAPSGRKGTKPMTLWEKFKAALGAVEVDDEPLVPNSAPVPPSTPAAQPGPVPQASPSTEGLAPAQIEFNQRLLASNVEMRRQLARSEAERWVESLVHGNVIAPVERSGILAMYAGLAEDEATESKKVSFGTDPLGQPAGEGTRLQAFMALFERRPKHQLLAEIRPGEYQALFNNPVTNDADKQLAPEQLATFLDMSPLGQRAIQERRKGGA